MTKMKQPGLSVVTVEITEDEHALLSAVADWIDEPLERTATGLLLQALHRNTGSLDGLRWEIRNREPKEKERQTWLKTAQTPHP